MERPPKVAVAAWPETALDGPEAKQILLDSLSQARARLEAAGGYTATFRRRERVNDALGDEQVIRMKCRNSPFAIYFRFDTPEPGKEVVYAEGRYDNQMIAHSVGFSRKLIPRIKVAPTSALAMRGNRHPITEAGLLNLTNRLINFRKMDLDDPEAGTTLDRWADPASGRTWLRSIHTHPHFSESRPFQYIEVLYDPETRIPHKITSYDWPRPGETGPRKLAEQYQYDDLDLKAPLTDLDFDPANPAYDFQ